MSRRVTLRTTHDDPTPIADAIAPDNTDEMETTVEEGAVVTRIERETTASLQATVDDYVSNLDVAIDVTRTAQYDRPTDAGAASDTTTTPNHE